MKLKKRSKPKGMDKIDIEDELYNMKEENKLNLSEEFDDISEEFDISEECDYKKSFMYFITSIKEQLENEIIDKNGFSIVIIL